MRPPAPPRALRLLVVAALALVAAATAAGCGDSHDYYSVEQLMDATNCMECHPQHYQEWSGSMHAYAADDPVFLAMNKRGQEETNGELGDFCVNCHAPMAVRLGLTTDGLNLDEVPQYAKGVTCYFCHSVESVGESHNNDITLATDGIMRGGLSNPVASPKHAMMTSPLVDADNQASSAMCGACHDVVTPAGVHLERTFEEWNDSIFASTDPATHLSCGQCHMKSRTDVAAEVPGLDVPLRQNGVRDHKFAGVDVALTPWPEKEAQLEAIQGDLDPSLLPRLCVVPLEGGRIDYRLDDVGPGHMWPSGAAHDRRAWAEVIAYDADDNVLMQTGVVLDGEDPDPVADPWIWEMRDYVYDADGAPVKYFWEVRQTLTGLLPPSVTRDPSDPRFDHSVTRSWHV
ncbi:MAG: hypothetical protein H6709_19700, partial [Kofleriaceae bacterium]|nr:hypothetical protein [Kofleriaceae bacterium]